MTDISDDVELYAVDIEQIEFESEISFYIRYLTNLEEFFTIQRQRINNEFEKFLDKEIDKETRRIAEQAQYEYFAGANDSENLFRKSFIANIYSFLEDRMISECRRLKREDILLEFDDVAGQDGIDKAQTYFTKVLQVRLPNTEWADIKNIQRLRNCIVHGRGRLSKVRESKAKEKLRAYISENNNLNLTGNEVYLEKGYCEDAYKTIETFLKLLLFSKK